MIDSGTMWLGRFAWGLAVAGLFLGSPGAALAASLPDLKVTALTNPPSTALPGVSFTVTATIKNGGSAEAPASTTKFSLSKDKKTATARPQPNRPNRIVPESIMTAPRRTADFVPRK